MSKEHVDDYFNQVVKQYHDMLLELKDFEEEAHKGLFPPERIDEIKKTIEPMKNNYEQISYIMYLFNKPTRKSKETSYERRNKKLLSSIAKENTTKGALNRNDKVLAALKELSSTP